MNALRLWLGSYLKLFANTVSGMTFTNIVEILILVVVYNVLLWIKNTKAWTLLKGIVVLAVFVFVVYVLRMDTLIFIVQRGFDIAVIAALVIFQPELRRALEQLGEKQIVSSLIPIIDTGWEVSERFSDKTVNEIVKAAVEMGRARTGALIVIECNIRLDEYERTGITLDSEETGSRLRRAIFRFLTI